MVLATDNFNRANNPISTGGDWSIIPGLSMPNIVSNQVVPNNNGGISDSVAYQNTATWPNDQYAQIKIVTVNTATSRSVGVALRAATGAETFYAVNIRGPLGAGATLNINKAVAGAYTTLVSSGSKTVASGDRLRGTVKDTTITAYLNGSAIASGSVTDSAISSGKAGVRLFVDAGVVGDAVLDDWEGGDFQNTTTTIRKTQLRPAPFKPGKPFGKVIS